MHQGSLLDRHFPLPLAILLHVSVFCRSHQEQGTLHTPFTLTLISKG